jgi:hypothetical protein
MRENDAQCVKFTRCDKSIFQVFSGLLGISAYALPGIWYASKKRRGRGLGLLFAYPLAGLARRQTGNFFFG